MNRWNRTVALALTALASSSCGNGHSTAASGDFAAAAEPANTPAATQEAPHVIDLDARYFPFEAIFPDADLTKEQSASFYNESFKEQIFIDYMMPRKLLSAEPFDKGLPSQLIVRRAGESKPLATILGEDNVARVAVIAPSGRAELAMALNSEHPLATKLGALLGVAPSVAWDDALRRAQMATVVAARYRASWSQKGENGPRSTSNSLRRFAELDPLAASELRSSRPLDKFSFDETRLDTAQTVIFRTRAGVKYLITREPIPTGQAIHIGSPSSGKCLADMLVDENGQVTYAASTSTIKNAEEAELVNLILGAKFSSYEAFTSKRIAQMIQERERFREEELDNRMAGWLAEEKAADQRREQILEELIETQTPKEDRPLDSVAAVVRAGEWVRASGEVGTPPVAVANAGTTFVLRSTIDEPYFVAAAHAHTNYIAGVEKLILEQSKLGRTGERSLSVVTWNDAELGQKAGIEADTDARARLLQWLSEQHPDVKVDAQRATSRTLYIRPSAVTQSQASLPDPAVTTNFDDIRDELVYARQ